ncbi:transmembrane protein 72-like [Scylla paramamosain]|uniref:transmembrane protein 72-like n=1 Tax=Scylla paramamosain TaxID=85552 RepID=UPI003083D572
MNYEEVACGCFWSRLPYGARVLGVTASLVVWGVGADMVYHRHALGIYTVLFAVFLFFLETTWAVTLFLRVCVRNEGSRVLKCWAGVLWLDTWKKTLLYWAAGGVFLASPHRLWLTPVAGGLLMGLGFLHLLLLYRRRLDTKEALLEAREESYESPGQV